MSKLIPIAAAVAASVAAVALTASTALSADRAMSPKLVRTIMDEKLGEVLTTPNRQAIYVWRSERKGTIRCTGGCAKAWPPV
ncbi:MAG TPA: hypothetical protein VF073_06235, partial [Gaiella sp.]